jgi:hypothetical protein
MIKIAVEVAILQGSEVSSNKCPANWRTLWRSCSKPSIKDLLPCIYSFYPSPNNGNRKSLLIQQNTYTNPSAHQREVRIHTKVHLNIAGSTGAPPAIGAHNRII